MAAPGFSINDLIGAAIQIKTVYDAFFDKYSNSATQFQDLIQEIVSFAEIVEMNREVFARAGLRYRKYEAIYETLCRCNDFLEKNKPILSKTKNMETIWRIAKFPYSQDYVQKLKESIRAHKADLTAQSVLHILDKTTTPNNGPAEPQTEEVAVSDQRRGTIDNQNYPVSEILDGPRIPNLPTPDSAIINNKYAYVTTTMQPPNRNSPSRTPPSRSLEKPGFYHDSQTLSPHRPPSSYGPSPQNSPELSTADTIRSSISPRSSPVPPPSSRLSSIASPQLSSCPELILPQPALDYVVAEIFFGTKKIPIRRKPAGRPSTSPISPGRELVIINEENKERIKHRIKLGSTQRCYPYTWNGGKSHSALEVTFTQGNHSFFFKGKQEELGSTIPRYVFSNLADFTDFQSAVRNKFFLGAFAIDKISSETSRRNGDATYQHLKIWRDKETRQCSLSFYGNSLEKARDLEFPFKYIKKEPETKRNGEELILRFDPLPWSQLRTTSPSIRQGHFSPSSESEYTHSRTNTFSTVSTDRTASTGFFSRRSTAASTTTAATSIATITPGSRAPSFGSQDSDSGRSVTSDKPPPTTMEDLTRKMKFLKITFPDAKEASRFYTAYKTAIADTPSLPIDFTRVDWRCHPHPNARLPSMSAPAAVKGGYTTAELEGSRPRINGSAYTVEMEGEGRFPAEIGEGGTFPVEMGEAGVYAVEMEGGGQYPVEVGGGGQYPVEMDASAEYTAGRYSAEMRGTPDLW
ncbi:hypothetical protein VE02_02296 [Pseudogymnoascus sp. 03VT05]|nr:hypothetical protein VE02_02296 [Pseudogymnoascus sp. 03VT05]